MNRSFLFLVLLCVSSCVPIQKINYPIIYLQNFSEIKSDTINNTTIRWIAKKSTDTDTIVLMTNKTQAILGNNLFFIEIGASCNYLLAAIGFLDCYYYVNNDTIKYDYFRGYSVFTQISEYEYDKYKSLNGQKFRSKYKVFYHRLLIIENCKP